ncbi:hypothetical protein [Paenibacillus pinistramenti]|uniref:hypothetical protein n=1 Tax=Paenibacillus pinistramenti TaxID=1768003 RepID=UPI001EEFFE22|nr:hypothetical protein [Paenibacillus pinistramenti]
MPHYNNPNPNIPNRNTNHRQGAASYPGMNRYRSVGTSSAAPPELPSVPQYYPGVNPYGISPESSLVPFNAANSVTDAAATGAGAAGKGGGLLSNIGDLKGMIDRLGGIDGIMGHIGRVQKIMSSFQQIAPMAKLLMGSFLPGGKAAAGVTADPDRLDEYRPKRRRKGSGSGRRRSSGGKGRSGKNGYRRSSSAKRRSPRRR